VRFGAPSVFGIGLVAAAQEAVEAPVSGAGIFAGDTPAATAPLRQRTLQPRRPEGDGDRSKASQRNSFGF